MNDVDKGCDGLDPNFECSASVGYVTSHGVVMEQGM